ncbi:MAG TPA: AarF/ABC1/UbiB kinase family protein [Candidatus Limnocylindria bacterium]|jgi:ubiquinone biosynthesis protein|nr:AarF/ABC1/UbiB kinase family protein [Candidatus Limnocylindria bacterium]
MLFQRFRKIGRAVEHAQRYRSIVGTFAKYGYADVVERLPLRGAVRWTFRLPAPPSEPIRKLSQARRLRHALEELGPTFVKLGQLLASRSHLLPKAMLDELEQLHDNVPPVPFSEVKTVIEAELGRPLAECFASIEEIPLGSASIAQVHAAVLLTGEQVVVKVQRPGIEAIVRTDLQIMADFANLLEKHVEGWAVHRPTAIVAEFAKRMEQELDFNAEAGHISRFADQFANEPTLRAPQVFMEQSALRVLTMERIDGIKVSLLQDLEAANLDRAVIANRVADLVMKQIFVHGFFHADPHPGNIHILPGNVVCFLDFGMMGFLDQRTREVFADLVTAIAQRNESGAASALLRLADAELDPPRQGLESDLAEFMHQHFYRPIGEMIFSKLVNHLFKLTTEHSLTMPPDLFTMLKALSMMENLVSTLDPKHDLIAQAKPFMRQVHMNRLGPKRLLRQLSEFGMEAGEFLRGFPMEVRRVLAQLKGGKAKVTFHHDGLEPLNNTLERVSNRLAFALVLASLLIASSLILHAGIPPRWHGVPVIGLAGYVFAGLMGGWLMLSILRHGKM